MRKNRSLAMKLTRWSKAHPLKAQVLIAFMQLSLMALGILAGYNLRVLGFEFSDLFRDVFAAILVVCFFLVPFLPKRNLIALPARVLKNRACFTGIAISSFVLLLITGSRLEDQQPNSAITHITRTVDHFIFNDETEFTHSDGNDRKYVEQNNGSIKYNTSVAAAFTVFPKKADVKFSDILKEHTEKLKSEKELRKFERKKAKLMTKFNKRYGAAGGTSFGAVLLIILLGITTCAGICLIIAGISGGGIGLIPVGIAVAGGSVFGIYKLLNKNKKPRVTDK